MRMKKRNIGLYKNSSKYLNTFLIYIQCNEFLIMLGTGLDNVIYSKVWQIIN